MLNIKEALVTARKAKDTHAVTVLTTVLGELDRAAPSKPENMTDEEVTKVIRKMASNLEETMGLRNGGTETEKAELEILNSFLPTMLSDTEIEKLVDQAIKDTGASSPKDMGKVMGKLKPHASVMDMKIASSMVKNKL